MLDLSSLALTDEEILDVLEQFSGPQLDRAIAAAQLAKALWGIQAWLEENGNLGGGSCCAAHALEDKLEGAGIPKEGEGGHAAL